MQLHDVEGKEEARTRFPELNEIGHDELRARTTEVVTEFPAYFWTAPASSNHHPPEHQQRHGLWLHTKRVSTAFERLAPSMINQGHLDQYDIDCGRAACILHDMYKYGKPPTEIKSTTDDHDIVASNWLDANTELPDQVVDSVAAHNGPWYQGPPPRSHLQQIVHIADMTASDENCRIAVKNPHPILREQFPRVAVR